MAANQDSDDCMFPVDEAATTCRYCLHLQETKSGDLSNIPYDEFVLGIRQPGHITAEPFALR